MAVPEGDTGLKKSVYFHNYGDRHVYGRYLQRHEYSGEKEDGTILVNDVLPRSRLVYLFQKIAVGLLGRNPFGRIDRPCLYKAFCA